ncbi:MAG: hypothetical protein ABI693_05055 [Bryobacteraceae bacterium]
MPVPIFPAHGVAPRAAMPADDSRDLKPSDDIDGPSQSDVARSREVEAALEKIRQLRRPLPAGFTFDRIEANES